MLKSSHPLRQRIGVAKLTVHSSLRVHDGCNYVLDTDQDGVSVTKWAFTHPIGTLPICKKEMHAS